MSITELPVETPVLIVSSLQLLFVIEALLGQGWSGPCGPHLGSFSSAERYQSPNHRETCMHVQRPERSGNDGQRAIIAPNSC